MAFTDPYIRRPVLATVISLLIFFFGLYSIHALPLQEFPQMSNTVITVTTSYPGASSSLVQGFITNPLEKSIATAEGIDYMTASSDMGQSTITAYIKLNFDPNAAFTNIMSKVQQVQDQLPSAAQNPVINKQTGSTVSIMYLSFTNNNLTPEQITDYLSRVVQPQLESVSGVAQAQILGEKIFAMRIWLDSKRLAALNLTPADITNALIANNYQAAAGATKGQYVAFNLTANTDLTNVDAFRNIVVSRKGDSVVRLGEVAKVQLGSQSYDSSVALNGKPAVFIGIQPTPSANPLQVIDGVDKVLPNIEKQLPPGFQMTNVYDQSGYINSSIEEVIQTILEAALIVIIVIFCFLGSIRSVIIPVITIPLSLVGVCTLLLALGYSLNLLTFLAMVLAIGLVVDDAIVVIENIYRHIEEGKSAFKAAILGAREIGPAIISMTITLAAVYAPIGFMGGLTGALFKEFAFTLASTVIISGVIALTLSPMMCSLFLNSNIHESKIVQFIDRFFDGVKTRYANLVTGSLKYRPVTALFAVVVLVSCFFMYSLTKKELAPAEDQGLVIVQSTTPVYSNFDYMSYFSSELGKQLAKTPALGNYFIINGASPNTIIAGVALKPWNQRTINESKIIPMVQKNIAQVPGLQSVAFGLPPLPGNSGGMPIEFVVTNISGDYLNLWKLTDSILRQALQSGMFAYLDTSLQFNRKEFHIEIDRQKAESMGISMEDISDSLSAAMSGNYLNYFSMSNRSYEVIPELKRPLRYNPDDINKIYVKNSDGKLLPLSTVVHITNSVEPNSRTEFQQQAAATIEGVPSPAVTMGTALDFLKQAADKTLPKGYSYNYEGQSRQYVQEGNTLLFVFFFAIIVIFLILAALFESFRDPVIVLISVPMSICGALIPLNLGLATINIYTQIGLVTLIGLISKHGILMVDFANQLQASEGLNKFDAIVKSASIRLRPILMTTFAMVFGVLPLIFSSGAGAASRFNIGLVIFFGMLIGTCFTLFVVPTMYTFFAKKHEKLPDVNF